MEYIHPKDRFSAHANCVSIPADLLHAAAKCMQLEDKSYSVTTLSGGFMNANFLVQSTKGDFVFRVYSTDRATAEREILKLEASKGLEQAIPESIM